MAIPENIEQLANDVRTKVYGREVREALASGIEAAGSIANDADVRSQETETKQTSLEKKYDEQIANMSLENPSVAEVVDARVSGYDGQNFDTIGKRMDKVDAQLAENINKIVQLSNAKQTSNNNKKASEYARTDKKAFDLRSENEWDYVLNASFLYGQIRPQTPNSNMEAVRAFNKTNMSSVGIQAKIYYDGTQNVACVGFNNNNSGVYSTDNGRVEIGFIEAGGGFCLNIEGVFTTLLAKNELSINNWYVVTLCFVTNSIYASVVKENDTMAKVLKKPFGTNSFNNLQVTGYSGGDTITNIRYIASNLDQIHIPNIINASNLDTPIKMNYGTNNIETIAYVPASYNPYIKNRVAIFFHGDGGHADDIIVWEHETSLLQPLLDNGYVIISSEYTNNRSWGNQQVTQDIADLMIHWKYHLNIEESPYIIGESMGGLTALNSIYHDKISAKAFVGLFPVVNLTESYNHGNYFKEEIMSAYGITDDSQFYTKTEGYDPLRDHNFTKYKYIPFKIWHSYSDTLVPRAEHSDKLKQKIDAVGGYCEIVTSQGEHGDVSNFNGIAIANFFNQY